MQAHHAVMQAHQAVTRVHHGVALAIALLVAAASAPARADASAPGAARPRCGAAANVDGAAKIGRPGELVVHIGIGGEWIGALCKRVRARWTFETFVGGDIP